MRSVHPVLLSFIFFFSIAAKAQTISSFTPASASMYQTVTITGVGFTGSSQVSFGGMPAISFTLINSTTITAVVGNGSSGSVSVTTSQGTASLAGFTYIPPGPLSWPFAGLTKPVCTTMPTAVMPPVSTCTKWPVKNDGLWNSPDTWNNGTLPGNMDIVCIPAGITVIVKNPTYEPTTVCPEPDASLTPRLFLFVCGSIDFDASGKLHLGCQSAVQIYPGGRILPSQGNSDLIQVGNKVVWRDNNTTLTGPTYMTDGCGVNGCVGSGILSVHFASFAAVLKQPYKVDLNWSTSTEHNSTQFVVEKSQDQQRWDPIAVIPAQGRTQTITNYQYTDASPKPGVNFYRLREVSQNGQVVFSDIMKVLVQEKRNISLFPNPAKDKATLYAKGGFQNAVIKIYNQNGAFIEQLNARNSSSCEWDIRHYSPGIYLVHVQESRYGNSEIIRMIRK